MYVYACIIISSKLGIMTTQYVNIRKEFAARLLTFLMLIWSVVSSLEAKVPFPAEDEVHVLREIADQLGKKDWDFSLNPCDRNNTNWVTPSSDPNKLDNAVYCDNCTADQCHVTQIILRRQDLAGVLPPSLGKLPYINHIDLSFNYLNGTIPQEWIYTKLQYLSVGVNRLSGPIPEYLGNISTLVYLSLASNTFSGPVPASLGKLTNLENLVLRSNNLTGTWPMELSNLVKLTELVISSNRFVGKLPDFSRWIDLETIEIQGSGFEGPVPASISLLENLSELRISDLNGGSFDFPQLGNLTGMQKLMLRNCNLSGRIPTYIAKLSKLQILDLSFNKLYGGIPEMADINRLQNVYLTSNFLAGAIPNWIQYPTSTQLSREIDLSYNNFSKSPASSAACRDNLSFNERSPLEPNRCLHPCTRDWYSFYINCGGEDVTIGDTIYEADEATGGSAKFILIKENWGRSSTGYFWAVTDRTFAEASVRNNISVLQANNTKLYMTARVSPSSLTYFGRCLANGNYTVKLHFAEITFTNNQSFRSLGRRIFDIYIQDELKLQNFNIEDEIGGVNKALIMEFKAVVKSKTLDIRFQWASQGTVAVPFGGNYGPLISAISVKSDFDPPSNERKKILIIVAVVVSCCLILIVVLIFWWKGCFGGRGSSQQGLRASDLQTGSFSLRQIKAATKNFDADNKIGEGGFGSVYKGVLLDGTIIAVKQLSSTSRQGIREFVNEVGMISGLQHPNLVKLYGCCADGHQLMLVYEYMENNSLAHALFGPEQVQLKLDWPTRQKICLGVARGLAFLHEESAFKVVHRDIKAANVLLDGELNPKISDFGLAKLGGEENTPISTRFAGTIGYMAPEYAMWGYLTHKVDVYSFGVLALEIVAGKSNIKYHSDGNYFCLLDKALVLHQKGNLLQLVDAKLASDYNVKEAIRMITVGLLCTNPSPVLRPTMSAVVSMLDGQSSVQELNADPSTYEDELKFKALRDKYVQLSLKNSSGTEVLGHSSNVTNNGSSSMSGQDLYSVNLYSQ